MNKDLIIEVEAVIKEVDRTHRYSMSKLYGLYNRVFGTNETPQSCASCLIRKVRDLKQWLETEKSKDAETEPIQTETPIPDMGNLIPEEKTKKTKK